MTTEPTTASLPAASPPSSSAAAAAALRTALRVAMLAAIVPTVLSAQGMVSVGTDVLALHLVVAIALAGFLELGLIASALLARASALAGRPAGADAWATWALSGLSGVLSATHELVGPVTAAGTRTWQHDPASLLAAGVRLAAPLVAAWLWERCLVSARRQTSTRSLSEVLRDRRMLAVARAALAVRRAETSTARGAERRLDRARRRLDRAHLAALRHLPATDPTLTGDLTAWLATVGAVDTLPDLTKPSPIEHAVEQVAQEEESRTEHPLDAGEQLQAHPPLDGNRPNSQEAQAAAAPRHADQPSPLEVPDLDDVTVPRQADGHDEQTGGGVQAPEPPLRPASAPSVPALTLPDSPVPALAAGALAIELSAPGEEPASTGDRDQDAVAILERHGRETTYTELAQHLERLGWQLPAGTSTRQRILTTARKQYDETMRSSSRLSVVR